MTAPIARRRGVRAAMAVLAVGLMAAAGLALAGRDGPPPSVAARPDSARPVLMLLTTLPLVFGERFGLEGGGSPALTALEKRYRVVPIGIADRGSLRQGRLLLMAHPLAQPAEALVELDSWVRRGGRVLLLADPALDWPSERPLGDRLRPPPMFADTGLLKHWGLTLEAPDERGPKEGRLAGFTIVTVSPGRLSGSCALGDRGLVAHCRIGRGEATVVADADFLNVSELDGPSEHNLDALLAELAALER